VSWSMVSDHPGSSAPEEHTADKGLENSYTFDAWVPELRCLDRSVVPESLEIHLVLSLIADTLLASELDKEEPRMWRTC